MKKKIKNLLSKDFICFIKNPNQVFHSNFKQDFIIFVILTFLNFFGLFVKGIVTKEPFIESSDLPNFTFSKIFPVIFLIPLIEEFAFRGFLQFRSKLIFISSLISHIILVITFVSNYKIKTTMLIVMIIIGLLFLLFKNWYLLLINFITNNLKILVFISSICFGIMHLTNFENFEWINLISIFEKIIAGIFLCYITRKYNIWHSYFFHILNNSIPFILVIIYVLSQ